MKTMEREQKQQLINLAIKEYLNTPEKERSLTKLGEKYGIRRQTISEHLKKRGVEVVNQQNRCRIDETVFDVIDTEEKAYWLGFMYADGNISSTGNRLEMNLSAKDLSHMVKFKEFLKLETDIRVETNRGFGYEICRLSVRNKHLWDALNSKGCTPCKSLTLTFPDLSIFSNKNLVIDFIRGYVDGDGCLCVYPTKNTHRTELSMVGTESFLSTCMDLLEENGYIKNKSTENYQNQAFSLTYSDLPSRRIARKLYTNATIYLERKYNIFETFCRLEEESSRRKSSKIGEGCDANPEVNN